MQQLLFLLAAAVCASVVDATYEHLFPGYTNVYEESIDADVIIERGQVPEWLEGKTQIVHCTLMVTSSSSSVLAPSIRHDCNPSEDETKLILSNGPFDKLNLIKGQDKRGSLTINLGRASVGG